MSLNNVKYTSILPMGKTGSYTENQKCQFRIPSDIAYIDGRQSYIYIECENTSTMKNSSTGVAVASDVVPVMLQPHVGVSSLVRRVQLTTNSGVELEDIDNYNTYVGLLNSYTHDADEYQSMGLVEGVSGHSPIADNRTVTNPNNNYWIPPALASNGTGGDTNLTASFCMPIHLGLFSGLGKNNEKQAYPNLPIGGSIMNLYLEQAKVALCEQASGFYSEDAQNVIERHSKNASERVAIEDYSAGDTFVVVKRDVQNFNTDYNAQWSDTKSHNDVALSVYKVGMNLELWDNTPNYDETMEIASIEKYAEQLKITFTTPLAGTVAGGFIRTHTIVPAFNISRIELRVLETVPANPQALRVAVNRGINYTSVLLNKLSQAAQLKNSVLNIPASMTRALSIFTCPCTQDDLETFTGGENALNSSLYPQLEDGVSYDWQYQVRQFLVPNRPVNIKNALNNENDNGIHYNQLQMAFRPLMECRCLNDAVGHVQPPLTNPVIVPILLAPKGSSYRLLDSEPQLRYSSSNASDTKGKLFHIYVNHVRTLQVDPATGQVHVIM